MTKPQVTIVGLGLIGGSIGLALKANTEDILVVGHDIELERSRKAQKMGALDKSVINLPRSCEDADLVVIATPIDAMRKILEIIGPCLKPGCVVTDTATLKGPVLRWAEELLPESIPFVGGTPLLNPATQPVDPMSIIGLGKARADLFEDALYVVCAGPKSAPGAVKRVTDMVSLIQARPLYVGPDEHDGMRAAVEGLPTLIGLALMQQVGDSPGWREARKLADHYFGMATATLADESAARRAHVMLNKEFLLPRLNDLMRELIRLREWMMDQDDSALEEAFEQAASIRDRWLIDRMRGEWGEELTQVELPGRFEPLTNLFSFGRRKSREE